MSEKVSCPKCHSPEFAVFDEQTVQGLIEDLLDSGKYFFSVDCQCVKCGQHFSLIFQLTDIFEVNEHNENAKLH
jgi:predicted nucleic-acid-binding Zn-ribbon protein